MKKILFLCMLCMLTLGANAQRKTTRTRTSARKTQTTTAVESSANKQDFIKKELAKYIKNFRKNPNVVLTQRAKSDLEESSWPEIQCSKTGDLDEVGTNVVVKRIGNNTYRYECNCTCGQETYVDNWIINATYSNGKVRINSFTVSDN